MQKIRYRQRSFDLFRPFITEKKDNDAEEKDLHEGSGIWFVEERNEMDGADGSSFANQQSHVKFETPKIPVIFVLGKEIDLIFVPE